MMVKEELEQFLRKLYPNMTAREGCAVYWLLENATLLVECKDICGSFRYNASVIAGIIDKDEGEYCNYYCSCPVEHIGNPLFIPRGKFKFDLKFAARQYVKIINAGAELIIEEAKLGIAPFIKEKEANYISYTKWYSNVKPRWWKKKS